MERTNTEHVLICTVFQPFLLLRCLFHVCGKLRPSFARRKRFSSRLQGLQSGNYLFNKPFFNLCLCCRFCGFAEGRS